MRPHPTPSSGRPLLFNFDQTLSKSEREQRRTQWVVLLTIVVFTLAVLIGLVGFYVNGIRQPGLPVATVDQHVIRRDTWQHYQALLGAELQGRALQLQSNPAAPGDAAAAANQQAELQQLQQEQGALPDQAVNDLINAQIIAAAIPQLEQQGAPANQLVPTAQQVDTSMQQEQQTLGATSPTDLQNLLKSIGISQSDLRSIVMTRLEQDNIRNYLSRDLKTVQPQVKARLMQFGDSGKAAEALKALRGGQAWTEVATQYAKDQTAKETSQDIDWTTRGLQDQTFDTVAFAAQPFQFSEVLSDNGQSEIIQVEDVAPARPLDQNQIDQVKTKTFSDWLSKQTNQAHVQRYPQNMSA